MPLSPKQRRRATKKIVLVESSLLLFLVAAIVMAWSALSSGDLVNRNVYSQNVPVIGGALIIGVVVLIEMIGVPARIIEEEGKSKKSRRKKRKNRKAH